NYFDGVFSVSDTDKNADVFIQYEDFPIDLQFEDFINDVQFNVVVTANNNSNIIGKFSDSIEILIPTKPYDIKNAFHILENDLINTQLSEEEYDRDKGLHIIDQHLSELKLNPM